jgi:DNA-binding transcriptional ArsR family regulator
MSLGQQRTAPVDSRLAKAFSHPMRGHILGILDTRVASPNEIAQELGERLPNVSYHVRALHDLGCIELVRTAQRRGAIEHYYRGIVRPFFDDREWRRLSSPTKDVVTSVTLRLIWDDLSAAIETGTFEGRPNRSLTRSPLVVDERGWSELNELMARVLEDGARIAAESADRLAAGDGERIDARVVLMHFELPAMGARPGA